MTDKRRDKATTTTTEPIWEYSHRRQPLHFYFTLDALIDNNIAKINTLSTWFIPIGNERETIWRVECGQICIWYVCSYLSQNLVRVRQPSVISRICEERLCFKMKSNHTNMAFKVFYWYCWWRDVTIYCFKSISTCLNEVTSLRSSYWLDCLGWLLLGLLSFECFCVHISLNFNRRKKWHMSTLTKLLTLPVSDRSRCVTSLSNFWFVHSNARN